MENFLEKIAREKKEEIRSSKEQLPLAEIKKRLPMPTRNFGRAIKRPGKISVIAELKKASPSAGVLRENFEPVKLAKDFEKAGASALSVLTEENYFLGKLEYIREVKDAVNLPILRKDFIIDEYQIYESLYYGADAILLIAAMLSKEELAHFIGTAQRLSLSALVEVHSEEELKNALSAGAEIIGINNRDLTTFKVDINTTLKVIKEVPEGKVVVSESGIDSRDDVKMLAGAGVHAVLVGEAIVTAKDVGKKIRELRLK